MKAVGVIPGRQAVELVDHKAPSITHDHDVRFRTLEVGICGTDREICTFVYGAPPEGFEYLILGHEALGEVVEVGGRVAGLKPGDLVVPSVRRPCQHSECRACREGLQDFCFTGDFTERGIKNTHGFLVEYVVEDAKYLNKVPGHLRDVAVLVEPLTVAEKALSQVWKVQERLPWSCPVVPGKGPGHCRTALVLGAGPVGILGAMLLASRGFNTSVYSRSKAPNPKSELLESIGVTYISALAESVDQVGRRLGQIDLIYEAVGIASISFDVLQILGMNGVFVFTGIPAPKASISIQADHIMRNLVLKNQMILGTVNADKNSFEDAIKDLAVFDGMWPQALRRLISGRFPLEAYRDLLTSSNGGIKNVIALD